MLKTILIIIGLISGVATGYFFLQPKQLQILTHEVEEIVPVMENEKIVLGFLPYWLLNNANKDYTPYVNTLAYFALSLEGDGTIQKYTAPGESEPGWYTLQQGKAPAYLKKAKGEGMDLSLVIFSGDEETIAQLLTEPKQHASNMMKEVLPLMEEHHFTDLNIDIESVKLATDDERERFRIFMQEVKDQLDEANAGTLSIDASPTVFIKSYLVNPETIAPLVDTFVIMGYDYHYQGSSVTGPVAPLGGAESISEFDTVTGVRLAVQAMPAEKIVLAIPLYGYEWETLDRFNRAATIPGSGITASNRRVEELIASCDNCRVEKEAEGKESYVVYENTETGTYHQIFYPDEDATVEKITLANTYNLGGIGLWALGYEGDTILNPLKQYK
ncbi:hypothetical protein KAZ66_04515 [Candidatus Woesebacteria bacterium]|nr:hypothetical protein [Candidatus Woesebacteria bacterium]